MDDYIKRDDVISVIENIAFGRCDDNDYAICELMQIPSADVRENVRGEWIGINANDCYPKCSKCGKTRIGSSLEFVKKHIPFCEKCGADMREV